MQGRSLENALPPYTSVLVRILICIFCPINMRSKGISIFKSCLGCSDPQDVKFPFTLDAVPMLGEAPPGSLSTVAAITPLAHILMLAAVGFYLSWLIGNTGPPQPPAAPGFFSQTWHGEWCFHLQKQLLLFPQLQSPTKS